MENRRHRDDEPKREEDPSRDIKDPPVVDDEPEPTEPEGDPKPNLPPIKVINGMEPPVAIHLS